jgi:putative YphP/YqiW family bacilliredoxin
MQFWAVNSVSPAISRARPSWSSSTRFADAQQARPVPALRWRFSITRSPTVFAGADVEATERARSYFTGYPPSSPSIALMRDGKLLWMLERRNIENQNAEMIASNLAEAFDKYCVSPVTK